MRLIPGGSTDELDAVHAADARRALNAFGSLAAFDGEGLPGAPALGGYDESDDVVVAVRLHYGDPAADGPWACVETARFAHTRMLPGPLRRLVEHYLRLDGVRFADVDWTAGTGTIVVDGRPRRAETVQAGRWRATRCEHDAAQITVVTRDWLPAAVTVRLGSDVEPVLAGRRRPPVPPPALPEPPAVPSEPHRPLADVVLRNTADLRAWLADGGPVPSLPASWGALWAATVRRQMDLADQTEPMAQRAVTSFTSHLSSLEHEFAWFRTDGQLRERAITETLLFTTGLRVDVPSRPAQLAWLRRTGASLPPIDLAAASATETDWIDAWQTWSQGASTSDD
jgi:hypothetical protein